MIAYKVVTKERKSAFLGTDKEFSDFPVTTEHIIKYKKGKTIEARKNTYGIFCFKTKKLARKWRYGAVRDYPILKVKSLCQAKTPKKIFNMISAIEDFLSAKKPYVFVPVNVPEGTICFDKVKVLD